MILFRAVIVVIGISGLVFLWNHGQLSPEFDGTAHAQQATTAPAVAPTPLRGTQPANTQTGGQNVKFASTNWTVNCAAKVNAKKNDAGALVCLLSQSIIVVKNRQRFVTVSIRSSLPGMVPEPYIMILQLPHGLALASGATIQIDDNTSQTLLVDTSDAQGVYARIGLSGKLLSLLQKGNVFKISIVARNGRKIIIPVTLAGFSAGFAKLK